MVLPIRTKFSSKTNISGGIPGWGGWRAARGEAPHISTVLFNQDRDSLYRALKLAMINSMQGLEHITAYELTMDGVSLWILLKAEYNNDQNVEHKILILRTNMLWNIMTITEADYWVFLVLLLHGTT
jgi:hypothetical protein